MFGSAGENTQFFKLEFRLSVNECKQFVSCCSHVLTHSFAIASNMGCQTIVFFLTSLCLLMSFILLCIGCRLCACNAVKDVTFFRNHTPHTWSPNLAFLQATSSATNFFHNLLCTYGGRHPCFWHQNDCCCKMVFRERQWMQFPFFNHNEQNMTVLSHSQHVHLAVAYAIWTCGQLPHILLWMGCCSLLWFAVLDLTKIVWFWKLQSTAETVACRSSFCAAASHWQHSQKLKSLGNCMDEPCCYNFWWQQVFKWTIALWAFNKKHNCLAHNHV